MNLHETTQGTPCDGTSWAPLGTGLGSLNDFVYALTPFDNRLIAGGTFDRHGQCQLYCGLGASIVPNRITISSDHKSEAVKESPGSHRGFKSKWRGWLYEFRNYLQYDSTIVNVCL